MNRLDTTQFDIPQADARAATGLIWGTLAVAAGATLAAIVRGLSTAHNPIDQAVSVLVHLPLGLLVLDAWSFLVAFLRRRAATPLRIPYKTPVILALVHLAAAAVAASLARFESFYELVWIDDRIGHYEVRWLACAGVALAAVVSVTLSVFEFRLVRWVLISEVTSAGPSYKEGQSKVEDVVLGAEHLYEAQVILNNLGYEVSAITGEMNEATAQSIRQFQETVRLESTGTLTARTMIDLRNQWREKEGESSPAMAVSEHAMRRTGSRIAALFRRS